VSGFVKKKMDDPIRQGEKKKKDVGTSVPKEKRQRVPMRGGKKHRTVYIPVKPEKKRRVTDVKSPT